MEVNLPADLQAKLDRIATQRGRDPETLAREAIERLVDYDARFIEAVQVGRASARRGDMLEHDTVVERIEQMFRS
jgi:predicted transcriptional regulator